MEGGSGRTTTFMDLVVRKTGQPSDPKQLSALVLGAGRVKGIWQLALQQGDTMDSMLHDPKRAEAFLLIATAGQPLCQLCVLTDPSL